MSIGLSVDRPLDISQPLHQPITCICYTRPSWSTGLWPSVDRSFAVAAKFCLKLSCFFSFHHEQCWRLHIWDFYSSYPHCCSTNHPIRPVQDGMLVRYAWMVFVDKYQTMLNFLELFCPFLVLWKKAKWLWDYNLNMWYVMTHFLENRGIILLVFH